MNNQKDEQAPKPNENLVIGLVRLERNQHKLNNVEYDKCGLL